MPSPLTIDWINLVVHLAATDEVNHAAPGVCRRSTVVILQFHQSGVYCFNFIFSRPPFPVISLLSLVSTSPIAPGRMNYYCLGHHLVNMSAVTRLYPPFQQTYH